MVLILPHIQNPPALHSKHETNVLSSNRSLVIRWDEDDYNSVNLASFFPIQEDKQNLEILTQCYMKGKKHVVIYLFNYLNTIAETEIYYGRRYSLRTNIQYTIKI